MTSSVATTATAVITAALSNQGLFNIPSDCILFVLITAFLYFLSPLRPSSKSFLSGQFTTVPPLLLLIAVVILAAVVIVSANARKGIGIFRSATSKFIFG